MRDPENKNNIPSQENLLQERVNGILPVIDIADHPFYVDVRMDAIRPHDDFSKQGIPFSEFKDFETIANIAWLFYNPRSHEIIKDVNIEQLYDIPKDWIVIEIPQPEFLDPYGCAVKNGWDIKETLKVYPIQANLKARFRFLNPNNKMKRRGRRR